MNNQENMTLELEKEVKDVNDQFVEFLHTKGLKAIVKLVIENIKKGAKESRAKTKEQIENSKKGIYGHKNVNAETLTKEFNEFLKVKGLSSKYSVTIEEIK